MDQEDQATKTEPEVSFEWSDKSQFRTFKQNSYELPTFIY